MAEQKKYVDSVALKHLLEKLRDKNASLYLEKTAEAAIAAKVKNALTLTVGDTDVAFDGSEAKSAAVAAKEHKHAVSDINNFATEVQKVIVSAGGTTHTHSNLETLEKINDDSLTTWNNKIGTGDVEKIVYTNDGVGGTTNVKKALDILVANVQITTGTLTQTTKNIDAVKKIADDAAKAAAAEVTRAQNAEKNLDTRLDVIEGEGEGSIKKALADAKTYADGKDAAIAAAQKAGDDAQDAVDALKGKVGEVPADKTVVQMIADAQTNATYDDTALKNKVATIEGDYLKAADKTELQGNIDTVSGVANAAKEKIDTFMLAADVKEGAVDTLKEIQDYITSDGAAAQKMTQDIAANAQAIKDEADRAKAAEKVNADAIAVLNGADTVEGSVAAQVKAVADDLKDHKAAQVTKEAEVDGKLAVIQGDATTEGSIAKALKDAKDYTDTRETAINSLLGTKDDAAAVDTAFGRIAKEVARATAAEGALDGRLDTAEGKITALETTVGNAQSGLVKDVADLKSINADTRLTAAEGSIKDLQAWTAAHGTITEKEIDDMLAEVYNTQA